LRELLHRRAPPRAEHHARAGGVQPAGDLQAQPAARTGDDDDSIAH
jgi:hypothetical protein